MPNIVQVDVAVVEEDTGLGDPRVWAVIKSIKFTTTDNPYAVATNPKLLPNNSGQADDIPIITEHNIVAGGVTAMPTLVLALPQSPFAANASRGIFANVPDTTPNQYLFTSTSAGTPGAELVATGQTAPPILLASTQFQKGTQYTFVHTSCSIKTRGTLPPNSALVWQMAPIPQVTT